MMVHKIITGILIPLLSVQSGNLVSAQADDNWKEETLTMGFNPNPMFDTCSNSFVYETWNNLDFVFSGFSQPVPAMEYSWDFGDGFFGFGQNATHTYSSGAGQTVYTVILTTWVVDSVTYDTCFATSSQDILAGNPGGDCVNWFSYSTDDDWTFTFTGNVLPQLPSIFLWDFGDGTTGTGQQTTHIFEPSGIAFYTVCLTTLTPGNSYDTCIAISCQDVWVGGTGNDCENWFTWEQQNEFTFGFHGESLPPAMLYSWDFGDGQTADGQNVTHDYGPLSGDLFLVTLTTLASDPASGDSCVAVSQQWIQTGWILNCVADFYYEQDTTEGYLYHFYDNSGPDISSRLWDFGDGAQSAEPNPVHDFEGPGAFNVCLTITRDSLGLFCTDMFCTELNIDYSLTADYSFVLDTVSGLTRNYYFSDQSLGEPSEWHWDFGDGSFSTDPNPVHEFENAGEYSVCLEVTRLFPNGSLFSDNHCNFLLTPDYYDLGGLAFIGNVPINNPASTGDTGIAYLYRKYANDVIPADTNVFYEFGYFWFPDVREGNYLVKAELTGGSVHSETFAPAYFGNVMNWESAGTIQLSDSNYYFADVHLTEISGSESGPGSVSGYVTTEPDSANSIPAVSYLTVFLLNENGGALNFTMTGTDGTFTFENIALGNYQLYAEATGFYTVAVDIVLNESSPVLNDVELVISDTEISGFRHDLPSVTGLLVFPNPASEELNLTFESKSEMPAQICLFTTSGSKSGEYRIYISPGRNDFRISIAELPSGVYFLVCKSSRNQLILTTKFIKR